MSIWMAFFKAIQIIFYGLTKGKVYMTTVEQIQEEIKSLPQMDYKRLIKWIYETDWKNWDKQIELDSNSGKLDFLVEEATKINEINIRKL